MYHVKHYHVTSKEREVRYMQTILSDKGHKRGEWDVEKKELTIRDGLRVTVYRFCDDGSVIAKDTWVSKKNNIIA